MPVSEETVDAQRKRHQRQVIITGFKRVTLSYTVPERQRLVVMVYRLLPLQAHNGAGSDDLLAEVLTAQGRVPSDGCTSVCAKG